MVLLENYLSAHEVGEEREGVVPGVVRSAAFLGQGKAMPARRVGLRA